MQKNNEFLDLTWDSNYFGVDSARINLNKEIDNINEIIEFCKRHQFITIYNYNNNDYNNYEIGKLNNCFLADINVQLSKKCKYIDKVDNDVSISNNCKKNAKLLNIAKECFVYSRFINDKNLDKNQSKLMYYNWLNNSFNSNDKYLCNYHDKGFLLFSLNNDTAIIELIGVNNNYKNDGIGTKLITAFNNYCYKKGIKYLQVGTQLNNLIAQKFYIKNEYKINCYNSIYHLWNEKYIRSEK